MSINIIPKVNVKNLFSLIDIPLVINILSLHYFIYCALLCFAFQHCVKFIECYVYCHISIFDSDVKVTNIAKKTVVSS